MQQKKTKNIVKDIITSITKFEYYEQFAVYNLKDSVIYALKILIIFAVITSMSFTLKIYSALNNMVIEIQKNITEMKYENGKMSINSDQFFEKEYSDFISINIIIDTSDIKDTKKQEYIEKINNQENGIIILKNECIVKSALSTELSYYDYQELIKNGIQLEKSYFIESIQGTNLYLICLLFFIMLFFLIFIMYGINIFIYSLAFALIGNLTSILLRMPLKYKETINISIHALTLPTVLHLLYIIVNSFTIFEIKYFHVMYSGVSYIYIITAILMIKTDLIKRQIELSKIMKEQQKIRIEKNLDDLDNRLDEDKTKKEESK